MALDLSGNPLLEAAQDSQSRRPLVEILSQNPVADIPFDGQYVEAVSNLYSIRSNVILHLVIKEQL